ncbi:MAG: hydantoinase/oxoprolinase family protein [Pseudomonadota bacterium]
MQEILLGIDTGGTYTDAVLFSDDKGVIAKAKSLTTKHDLSIGISGAVNAVMAEARDAAQDIKLVSISTTLATNALVEGKGGSVALVMIGFDQSDMERAGLKEALGDDPVIFIPGGHNVQGNEQPLDMSPLDAFVSQNADKVSGFAVAGYFAVRNASHELKVRDYLSEKTGLPIACSHELSTKLGGPKRALTTLLNARLVPAIHDLISACQSHINAIGILAPLMVVRGDGALVSAQFASHRPIETILSGPAASLVGAKFLLGTKDAIVSDIGGTTTDVAILDKGWPRIEPEGAKVGGFVTMVEAVAMHTFGLGGDSAISVDETNDTKLSLGPRRQIPISLLALQYSKIIADNLKRQLALENPGQHACRFAMRKRGLDKSSVELKLSEEKLFARLTEEPQALDKLLKGASEAGTLNRLVSRGLAEMAGLTPSDCMHVLGLQDNWNATAALEAVNVFCRVKDKMGQPIAETAEALAYKVKNQLTLQSSDCILDTCMSEQGTSIGPGAKELIARALYGQKGFVQFSLSLDRPLVGLGASAGTYYPAIGEILSSNCIVPEHADVANAIGAVAGEVRITREILISSADGGGSFTILFADGPKVFASEKEAFGAAETYLDQFVKEQAIEAGAYSPVVETKTKIEAPEIEGNRHFVSALITKAATGKPDITKL